MIEVKATTTADHRTEVDLKVDADLIEYGAEVLAIIHSLMGNLKRDDVRLHTAVLKAMAEDHSILFGDDDSTLLGEYEEKDDKALKLAEAMSRGILKKGVN